MRRIDVRPRRGGFTLIEMLIVITIIITLMAITASAVMKAMSAQANNNTQTTLNNVQALLNRQWSAAKDQAWKEAIPAGIQSQINPTLTGTDQNATARMRVIYVKLRMRQMFPMNFNEAINPSPLPPLPAYQSYLGQFGIGGSVGPSGTAAAFESSACLLMALQRAQSGGGSGAADIGGGGASAAFGLPNGQSIRAFTDAWGQPIYFTRVPAGYPLLNPNPYVPGSSAKSSGETGINDPGDPQGLLNALGWPQTANTTLFTQLTLQPLAAQNCSFNLMPMIASGGPDKKISDPIWFSMTQLIDNDNIYSNP